MLSKLLAIPCGICLYCLPFVLSAGGVSVLLTNDDGYDSPGIRALSAALAGAGYEVTIVAPLEQQSGSGMKVTLDVLDVVEQGAGVWTVDGSPADAVAIGIHRVMRDDPPDVVISGANLGQNLGSNVMLSGTVGAAAMAAHEGIPAIAVSVGIDLAEHDVEPERFPSTLDAFPRAARLTVRVLTALARRRNEETKLMPPGAILNLNYPVLPATSLKGVRAAQVGEYGGFRLSYPEDGSDTGTVRATIEQDPRGLAEVDADTALFVAGFVTISVIEPRWNTVEGGAKVIPEWIIKLERELGRAAP
ncbi:MAG: 5'/3'-nucleotidase SurE [Pseudomonadota bacterium]|nr:5'/3'-nucleotidase SurE [Pseudomonadota bacterium]